MYVWQNNFEEGAAILRLKGCQCRQMPQGGAVTEGALTRKLLSPAALLIKQCAAPEHKLFSH